MSDVSIGPGSNKEQSPQESVDAQAETERDIDRAQAGAEAKPFANQPRTEDEDSKPAMPKSAQKPATAEGGANLISGRRNAGRE